VLRIFPHYALLDRLRIYVGRFPNIDVGDKAVDIGLFQSCYSPIPDRRRDGSPELCRGYRT
jgi:hypothetical protein